MSSKILVADDSLTIQKVVGITLSNTGLSPVECLNEKDLFNKLKKDVFDLLLLDYNLSETKSGQSLIQEISSLYPNLPILAMLGTFDSVDEDAILRAGAKDKIVKPFDGQKFIQLCKSLVEGGASEAPVAEEIEEQQLEEQEEEVLEEAAPEEDGDNEDGAGWGVVESPNVLSLENRRPSAPASDRNVLAQEIEGWGMSVPGVIGERDPALIPPKIERGPIQETVAFSPMATPSPAPAPTAPPAGEGPNLFPHNEDLDFPDLEAFSRQASGNDLKDVKLSSKLVPLSELATEPEESDDDETDPNFSMPSEDALKLEMEIHSEISPDEFWAADESAMADAAPITAAASSSVSAPVHSHAPIELELPAPAPTPAPAATVSTDEMVERMKQALAPMIEQLVKEHCQKTIEKVAWEVIPDLAENLIKKELGNISQSIK